MYLIVWGNTLLLQSPKNVLMTFDVHCPSGLCQCVCMGTDSDRSHQRKKKSGNSLLPCEVISVHLVPRGVFRMQVVQHLREAEPP